MPEYERERIRKLAEDDAKKRRHWKEGTRRDSRKKKKDEDSDSESNQKTRRLKRKRSEEKEGSSKAKPILDLRTNRERMLDLQKKQEEDDEPINPKLGV